MIKNLLPALIAICITMNMEARDTPFGFLMTQQQLDHCGLMEIETFDHAALLEEDAINEHNGGRTRTGRIAFVDNLDATNCGTWFTLENGDKVWILHFRTMHALATNVYFDNLSLPQGSSLFLYSADRSYFEGPYTMEDCNEHGRTATAEVFGDEAYLEYYEPAGVVAQPSIGILGIGHLYNHVHDYRDENRGGGSDFCEVDVNCPEGDAWVQQRDAVIRLTLVDGGSQYLCSGAFVNNVEMDCTRYILTAFHCTIGISDDDLLLCTVRFNYQKASCATGSVPSQNKTGVFMIANSDDDGGDEGSDFALLELEDTIPASWDVFYAGWDATTATPQTGVGIHHPAGDVKKISTCDDVVSSGWGAANTHWRTNWIETETEWGVTEGGSSGSPFYNQDKRIVGQLTGGGSCCTTNGCGQGTGPTQDDYYGKMKNNWNGNPNAVALELRTWLDPNNTGTLIMDGAYANTDLAQPCTPFVGVEELLTFNDVLVFPSASAGTINVQTEKYYNINEVNIFDNAGALVGSYKLNSNTTVLDLSAHASGFYFITFTHANGNQLTKKFTIVK